VQVVQKNPQLVLINMAATPQYIVHVKTAITNSGLNVNIQQDGTSLFVPIPRITREHREMLAKNAKTLCDKTKEKLRNIQNSYARDLKKAKDLYSEDLIFNLNETVLGTTKEYSDKAEKLMATKQQELLKN
jgi:ribosome recycling factor